MYIYVGDETLVAVSYRLIWNDWGVIRAHNENFFRADNVYDSDGV